MERCPNCRASFAGGETCRGCGMDLGLLLAVEAAAERETREGLRRLAGNDPTAVAALVRARRLRRDPFLDRLIAFARDCAALAAATADRTMPVSTPGGRPPGDEAVDIFYTFER